MLYTQENLSLFGSSHFQSKSLCYLTQGEVFLVCGFCVVFLSRSRRLVSFLSLGVVCCCFHVRIFWPSVGGDGVQTQRKSWVPGHIRAEQVLADAITIDAREEWICKLCSKTNVWTRGRCRRCYSNIPAGLQEKHKQAIFAKNKGWSSGSFSSSGGEQKTPRDQEEEIKKLRAQVEILSKQQRMEKGRRPRESRREEEVVLKKTARSRLRKKLTARISWVSRGKVCRNSSGTLRSLRTWSRCSRTARKKSGRVSYKRLKGRGQNFCRSTRRCRRGLRSCRVCRTRREIYSKRLVLVRKKCRKSVTKWRKEGCVLRLCEKNRATVGWQQMMWKTKSRSCRQERKEEAAVRRRPTDVALIQPCSGAIGRRREGERERGREEWEGDRDDEHAASGRYEGATLGLAVDPARHQDANGGSGGGGNLNTPRNGLDARDSSAPFHRAGNGIRRKRMNRCYKGWREGQHWQNEQ